MWHTDSIEMLSVWSFTDSVKKLEKLFVHRELYPSASNYRHYNRNLGLSNT